MSWQVLRLHRGKVEEPFTHTCLPLMANTGFGPSRAAHPHVLCHKTAAPFPALQGHEPSFIGQLYCWHVWSPSVATPVWPPWIHGTRSMAGRSVQGVQTGTSFRTLLLTMHTLCKGLCRLPSCHFIVFVHVNLYPISKPFVIPALSIVFVASRTASSFTSNQPDPGPPKHISPRNTRTGTMPMPWLRAASEFLQCPAHSSGTEAGAACEETSLQLHFTWADTHHLHTLAGDLVPLLQIWVHFTTVSAKNTEGRTKFPELCATVKR